MSERVQTMQDVYDLIIATCQEDREFNARGASALRFLNQLERDRSAQGIEAATAAETVELGSVHESPVGNADAPRED